MAGFETACYSVVDLLKVNQWKQFLKFLKLFLNSCGAILKPNKMKQNRKPKQNQKRMPIQKQKKLFKGFESFLSLYNFCIFVAYDGIPQQ